MDKKVNKDLENLEKLGIENPGFKVPSNYFEEFSDALFTKIEEDKIPKETGFLSPNTYFDNLEETIISRIDFPKKKKNTKIKILYTISSIAAAVVLYLGISKYQQPETITFDSITVVDVEEWITSGNMSINSYDIASIETDVFTTLSLKSNDFSNEELNDYLDTVDTEFLFLEN